MLEKEFVPHEPSLALKELGFNEPCFAFYNGKFIQSTEFDFDSYNSIDVGHHPLAPTYSQAFRWFREKYKLFYSIERESAQEYFCNYSIKEYDGLKHIDHRGNGYRHEEEAELACLIKLIQIVKNK